MEIVFSRLFWGLFIILIGVLLIMKTMFNMNIPVMRIAAAAFFIVLGISLLFSNWTSRNYSTKEAENIFGEKRYKPGNDQLHRKYSNVFGSQVIDLRDIALANDKNVEISCVFGSVRVILPKDTRVRIEASAVFGSAELPDGNKVSFGDHTYNSPSSGVDQPLLNIKAEVVFGSIEID